MMVANAFDRDLLRDRASQLERPMVFTNGVFDLLHRGHVEYLQAARRLGSSLIVGLNSDASVRTLNKGIGRPLNCASDRAIVLSALQCVSLVVLFEESTPQTLLTQLKPDIYTKGGDYRAREMPEAALMKTWGGQTIILPYWAGHSTTHLIARAHQIHSMEQTK